MSFPRYDSYKESGIEWLGEVPEHWDLKRYKHALTIFQGAAFKSNAYVEESDVINIRMGNIKKGGFIDLSHNTKFLPNEYKKIYCDYELREGDLIIAMTDMSPSLDFLAVPATMFELEEGKTYLLNQRVGKLILKNYFSADFIKYQLLSVELRNQLKELGLGTVQANMSNEHLLNAFFACPIFDEQQIIAQFLDKETAKIDNLITEQERLIALLKEKRQAVISHAVTKGLNPDVPMKDSGVEWLGEVPEHWVITKAKFVSNIFVPQRNKPELNNDCGVAWATMEDMKSGCIESTNYFVDSTSAKIAGSKVLKAGAVIASCVGNFDVVSINLIDVIINQQLQAFIPFSIKAEYLRELIKISKYYFESVGTAATLVYVNQQGFENLPVLVPSVKLLAKS